MPKMCIKCGRSLTTKKSIARNVCKKCAPHDGEIKIDIVKLRRKTKVYITDSLFNNLR